MRIPRLLQWRRRSKPLGEHLNPEAIAKLLRETKPGIKAPQIAHFQFVLILADDSKSQAVPPMIVSVLRTLDEHRASVSNITSSLFVALLGVPFGDGNSAEARQALAQALLRENGDQIKIAHGECDGMFGTFGSTTGRCTYGGIIPGFSAILKQLLETKFGTAIEIDGKTPNG